MKLCFVTAHVATRHHTMMRAIGMAPVLAALGHDVTILAEQHPDNRELIEPLPGVRGVYVDRTSAAATVRRKLAVLAAERHDVVHSCGLDRWTRVPAGACRGGFRIVDHVERVSAIPGLRWPRRLYHAWAERRSLAEADGTVVASRYLEFLFRRRLLHRRLDRPLLWLPYAVPQATIDDLATVEPRLGPRGQRTIIYAGGFYRAYGVHEIVAALALLKRQESGWDCLFLGQGPEQARLQAAVAAAGLDDRVTFPGYLPLDQYARTLATGSVLVSPMHDTEVDWARCPSKLYFYIAARRPIVTARIGENAEALQDAGFYHRPGDVAAMAATMAQALRSYDTGTWQPTDPTAHSWDVRCRRYLAWLEDVL